MAGGHFSTYSVRQSNEDGDGCWTHSNDRVCTPASLQDVLEETDGYIVTYSLEQTDNNDATTVTVAETSLSTETSLDEESSTDMQVALSDSTPYTSSIVDSDTDESVQEVIKKKRSRRSNSSSRLSSSSHLKKKEYVVDLTDDDDEVIVIENKNKNNTSTCRAGKRGRSNKRHRTNSTPKRTMEVTEIIDLENESKAKKSKVKKSKAKRSKAKKSKAKSNDKADDDDDNGIWMFYKQKKRYAAMFVWN